MQRALLVGLAFVAWSAASSAAAQADREISFRFQPVGRAQLALWLEDAAGTRFRTVRLTQAVARRGIGNRPGASQMNSGFRWPYGRREGVLPIWATRRAATTGASFRRVVFDGRESEGLASVSFGEPRNSRDDYFCLSFDLSTTTRAALDAVSCASVFNSNKGRYMTVADVMGGYAEPFEDTPSSGRLRALTVESAYPPRRDVVPCMGTACEDSADVFGFDEDARLVMPEIDTVTTATFEPLREQTVLFTFPSEWPDGDYLAFLEIHVEGDYNDSYGPTTHPTPSTPAGEWDTWAMRYGYPFRGQPSIAFRVPFTLSSRGADVGTAEAWAYGRADGTIGAENPIDATITDDPDGAPGSGVDRLGRLPSGDRFAVSVMASNVCGQPDPPLACSSSCGAGSPCPDDFVCAPMRTCVGLCDIDMAPPPVRDLAVAVHSEIEHAHEWAHLSFVVPEHTRALSRYEVRVASMPIDDEESFTRAAPANAAAIDSVELVVPVGVAAGELVRVDLGGLLPKLTHWVAVRPIDECNDAGEIAVGTVETAEIHFTTVSPCFVATAAHGTPSAAEIGVLRRFRDRHLLSTGPGRAIVRIYHGVGPRLAAAIRPRPWARALVRSALEPSIALARLAP